ncbi:MAG: thiamine diphosphokinase [Clostridiales bacterium]|nr:thiamine diphosphokinase [Clostridiales bacterium]
MTEDRRFLIYTALPPEGGALPALQAQEGAFVACADGGYAWAREAGVRPDIVIGDMDSLSPELLLELEKSGIATERHPPEKDDTDTLLCVKYGLAHGFSKFTIFGGIGGEFAHTLANLQALSFLADMECEAEILTGRERLFMLDGETVKAGRPGAPPFGDSGMQAGPHETVLFGAPGQRFSVFSYAERTSRVTIGGAAKYPLANAVLTQSYPIGLHNEFTAKAADGLAAGEVRFSIGFGRVLIVVENGILTIQGSR